MPEGANVEIAHRLTEQEHDQHDGTARKRLAPVRRVR